jgi:hypothetical protein
MLATTVVGARIKDMPTTVAVVDPSKAGTMNMTKAAISRTYAINNRLCSSLLLWLAVRIERLRVGEQIIWDSL